MRDALLVFMSLSCSKERVPFDGMCPPCIAILVLLPWQHVVLITAHLGGGGERRWHKCKLNISSDEDSVIQAEVSAPEGRKKKVSCQKFLQF